jgi:hypothetical protein
LPPSFDAFEYVSSIGASGGILTAWKISKFSGTVVFQNRYALSIEFTSTILGASWILTNIYDTCTMDERNNFFNWLNEVDMSEETEWLLVGDFNLMRRPSDRNKAGGNVQNMLDFNVAISNLRLEELKMLGNKCTWANIQSSPLLERLDWFSASVAWMAKYPGSYATTLIRDYSNHSPCLVTINTDIPKAQTFRFENYWMMHEDFLEIVQYGWQTPSNQVDKAKKMDAKLKELRKTLRQCHQQLSNLAKNIKHNKYVIFLLGTMEEFRDLFLEEWNFRRILHEHLENLLEQQRIYWNQRSRIKWTTLGDENTKKSC